ncbi:hypothetical protein BH11PLA2_BH11PLA2_48780 [soil metagenome]
MATNVSDPQTRETITPIIGDFIVSTPGTCDGEPRIAGTRINVRHVYTWVEQQGMSAAQVVETYPHLSRSAVHAALAYYWSHPDQIHQALDAEDRLVADLKAQNGPSLVSQKLAAKGQRNGPDDPLPS